MTPEDLDPLVFAPEEPRDAPVRRGRAAVLQLIAVLALVLIAGSLALMASQSRQQLKILRRQSCIQEAQATAYIGLGGNDTTQAEITKANKDAATQYARCIK